jgi:hypothetical protein
VVEAAIILPVAFFLIFGLIIGGLGVFRYCEVAHLARETARFASVHGGQYAKDNKDAIAAGTLPTVDKNYLVTTVTQGNAIALDGSQLQVTVSVTVVTPSATSASSTETVDWKQHHREPEPLPLHRVDGQHRHSARQRGGE